MRSSSTPHNRRWPDLRPPASRRAPARRFEKRPGDGAALDAEPLYRHERPDGPPYWTAGRFAWFSGTERPAALTAPSLGEPSREVLLETGLLAPAVGELVATGAVVQGTRLSSRTTIAELRP